MTSSLRALTGLAFAGYGLLVVLRVLAHDALLVGVLALVVGIALLLSTRLPKVDIRRGGLIAGLGAATVAGVLGYNLVFASSLSPPEWGILAYGAALLGASRYLEAKVGRFQVGTLVAWSFPLLLAPLLLFSLNAVILGPAGGSSESMAAPVIHYLLVHPMAAGLNLLGTSASVIGNNIEIETARGSLVLGVGLVCAGLYPMVLFMGILGLHAWRAGISRRLFGVYMAIGLVSLYLLNIVRLVLLGKIGEQWGASSLQDAHAHLGWLLFGLFMVVFWLGVVRHFEPASEIASPGDGTVGTDAEPSRDD